MLNMKSIDSGMGRLKAAYGIALMMVVGFALLFSGCEGKKTPAKDPVVTKQIGSSTKAIPVKETNDKLGPLETATAPQPSVEVAVTPGQKRTPYNPIGKVDPFAPLYKEEAEKKAETVVVKPKEPERPRTPLEKLDLGQLKLTAIVTTQNQRRALVEEATGKGYVVEIGTKVGLERGSVVEITQDRIIIEHQGEDDFGKATSRKRELKLQKPPGD